MPLYMLDGVTPELPQSGKCWIAPDAVLVGKIKIGEQATVWFGAILRGDNEIIEVGNRSNVQDGSVLHTDIGYPLIIGEGCTIGHKAILHGCTIGNNTLIGMGATVMNGAKVGNNVLVGAGSLIPEGKEIPDNTLVVGVPAKVIRNLDTAAIDKLRASATHYVQNGERYASGFSIVPKISPDLANKEEQFR